MRCSGSRQFVVMLSLMQLGLLVGCSGSPIVMKSSPVALQVEDSTQTASETKTPSKVRTIDEMLLFQPAEYPKGNWKPQQLTYQDCFFASADGTKLHAWYCPVDSPQAVVLYFHGNAGNLSGRAALLRRLQNQHRCSVMIFDYRGYGRSAGKATAEGAIQDGIAARKELAKLAKVTEENIVLMGRSLGGAIAIQLAAEKPPRGLVVESSFSSLKAIANQHFPKLAWLVPKGKLNSIETIAAIDVPILMSHGDRDHVIPFSMGRALYKAAQEPKQFVTIGGAGHNDRQSSEYYQEFDQFITGLP